MDNVTIQEKLLKCFAAVFPDLSPDEIPSASVENTAVGVPVAGHIADADRRRSNGFEFERLGSARYRFQHPLRYGELHAKSEPPIHWECSSICLDDAVANGPVLRQGAAALSMALAAMLLFVEWPYFATGTCGMGYSWSAVVTFGKRFGLLIPEKRVSRHVRGYHGRCSDNRAFANCSIPTVTDKSEFAPIDILFNYDASRPACWAIRMEQAISGASWISISLRMSWFSGSTSSPIKERPVMPDSTQVHARPQRGRSRSESRDER